MNKNINNYKEILQETPQEILQEALQDALQDALQEAQTVEEVRSMQSYSDILMLCLQSDTELFRRLIVSEVSSVDCQ